MLSAKIKDEPVNQMVPCKSSFAFEEWNEEPCCRDREIFRYQAAVCPAGSGAVPEQQEGLCRISVRFIHSSAGGGTHCRDKCGRCQVWSHLSSPAPVQTPSTGSHSRGI